MRRDYFTLAVDGVGGDATRRPVVTVTYEGPAEQLEPRLRKGDALLEGAEIDVAYRLHGSLDDEASGGREAADGEAGVGEGEDGQPDGEVAGGVVALADRVTGEYVLELNAPVQAIFDLVTAAREYGDHADDEHRYRIVLETDDGELATFDKSTLLVYDSEGELLRGESLIPSGVEI